MDERLKKALEFSNYRIGLFNLKENIKLKSETILTHAVNGGIFKANMDLINFLDMLVRQERESAVLIDSNGNPIEITDLMGFRDELMDRYFRATNFYHVEYTKLKKARSVKDQLGDLFEEDL